MPVALAGSAIFVPVGIHTTVDVSSTIQSGTTLSLLFIGSRANVGVTELPSWNATEDFTLITNVDGGSSNYDTAIALYGLVNPTAKTTDIDYTMDSGRNFYHSLLNFSGTIATSVANATNVIEEVNNTGNTNTTVFASGGTTGRTTVLGAVMGDANSSTISDDASMTELYGAAGSGNGTSHFVSYKIAGAAHAVTITWGSTNENTGIFLELIPAAGGASAKLIGSNGIRLIGKGSGIIGNSSGLVGERKVIPINKKIFLPTMKQTQYINQKKVA